MKLTFEMVEKAVQEAINRSGRYENATISYELHREVEYLLLQGAKLPAVPFTSSAEVQLWIHSWKNVLKGSK